jgi:hypothetical protein
VADIQDNGNYLSLCSIFIISPALKNSPVALLTIKSLNEKKTHKNVSNKFAMNGLFVLWFLTPLSTIFQLYRGGHVDGFNFKTIIVFHCKLDRRGRDRIVVGFITTYAISAYHH